MSDIVDIANDRADELLQDALAARSRQRAAQQARLSSHYCEQCDEPIPPERRSAVPGVQLCCACQETLEKGLAR